MDKDITELITQVVWSGDYQQAARTLALSIAVSPTDANLPTVKMAMGNMVKLFDDDGSELFRGYAFSRDKSNANSEMTVTAYDAMIYLTKSKGTYNFKKMTAEAITRKVAGDFGIPVGKLPITRISQSFIADAQAISDIIGQAYMSAGCQNGKKYMINMNKGLLNVTEKGSMAASYILSDSINISDSQYTESIENVIDRVKIYDDKSNQIGIVQNASDVKKYGVLQDTYTKESDKNAQAVAKSMLKSIERTSNLTALGYRDCIAGNVVTIQEPYTGVKGKFLINTDQHTWQDGQHTMQITLDMEG